MRKDGITGNFGANEPGQTKAAVGFGFEKRLGCRFIRVSWRSECGTASAFHFKKRKPISKQTVHFFISYKWSVVWA
jgi:hypothetical protein